MLATSKHVFKIKTCRNLFKKDCEFLCRRKPIPDSKPPCQWAIGEYYGFQVMRWSNGGKNQTPPLTLVIYFFPTIITASKVAPGIYQIKGQFDKLTKIHPSSRAYTTRSAKDDEMLMLKDLRKLHS